MLLLLDEHLGTDEIAERLFISEHTVRSHVKSLLRKLNVSSRREALDALGYGPGRLVQRITHRGGCDSPRQPGPLATDTQPGTTLRVPERGGSVLLSAYDGRPPRAGRCHSRNPSSAAPTSDGSVRGS